MHIEDNYKTFFSTLKSNGIMIHNIRDNIYLLGKGDFFRCRICISANEPKIYFDFDYNYLELVEWDKKQCRNAWNGRAVRILDSGEDAAKFILEAVKIYEDTGKKMKTLSDKYYG